MFRDAGWGVVGICASEESAKRLASQGLNVSIRNLKNLSELQHLAKENIFDVVVHCASSGRGEESAYRAVYLDGMRNLVTAFPAARHFFTGSTSVYAQTDGSVVDEQSAAEPSRETGRILLEAENACLAAGGIALRLGGLYGPGRWVLAQKFLSGEAKIDTGKQRWINEIHRDDAACALLHLANSNAASGIYNVCDDTPATQREIYGFFAEYFQRAVPPEGEPNLQRKRGWTSKRVSNAKLRATGWQPKYPSYREAVREIYPA